MVRNDSKGTQRLMSDKRGLFGRESSLWQGSPWAQTRKETGGSARHRQCHAPDEARLSREKVSAEVTWDSMMEVPGLGSTVNREGMD